MKKEPGDQAKKRVKKVQTQSLHLGILFNPLVLKKQRIRYLFQRYRFIPLPASLAVLYISYAIVCVLCGRAVLPKIPDKSF